MLGGSPPELTDPPCFGRWEKTAIRLTLFRWSLLTYLAQFLIRLLSLQGDRKRLEISKCFAALDLRKSISRESLRREFCTGRLPEIAIQELGETARGAVSRFALVFQQGRDEGTIQFSGEPIDAATGFFAMLQGLQVLVRASGDTSAFQSAADAYIDSITLS